MGDGLKVSGSPLPSTALQKHLEFFDKNKDRIVTQDETQDGLKRLGLSTFEAWKAAAIINDTLGPKTNGRSMFIPFNRSDDVFIDNIEKAMHGGDSGVFDAGGNFETSRLAKMFEEYDTNKSGSLSTAEVDAMQEKRAKGVLEKIATNAEFDLLFQIAADGTEKTADKDGKTSDVPSISRQRFQEFYEGTLFYTVEQEVAAKKAGDK